MSFPTRTLRQLVAALTLALLAASCTAGGDSDPDPGPDDDSTTTTTESSTTTEPEPPEQGPEDEAENGEGGVTVEGTTPSPPPSAEDRARLAGLPGRLAVGAAAELSVTAPDGTALEVLSDGAEPATQPVWSSDGRWLAWNRTTPDGNELAFSLADGSGDELVSPLADSPAFYLQWSASADRVAYLRTDPAGRGVELGTAVPGQEASPVLATAPLFVAWSPGSLNLAAHLGGNQVGTLAFPPVADPPDEPVDETEEEVAPPEPSVALDPTGLFTTPGWIDSRTLVVVAEEGLALLDVRAGQTDILVEAEEEVLFVVSPDRRRVAYYLPELSQTGVSVVAFSQAQAQAQEQQEPRVAGLAVLDLATGESVQVSPTVPLSFEWSPDGSRLAWLADGFDGVSGRAGWSFWDGLNVTLAEPYQVSDRDRNTILPFFEQYAQSHSRWSPDGSAFAFAGIVDGEPEGVASGIWVHVVGTDQPSVRVATGDQVIWGR